MNQESEVRYWQLSDSAHNRQVAIWKLIYILFRNTKFQFKFKNEKT